MTPSPQETMAEQGPFKKSIPRPLTGDEVVISGMSGIFPSSDSVQQFKENIYNKVNMVTSDNPRWVFNHPEVPKHLGKVSGMGKFDAQFFRVHFKQACTMEPMSRKLLEHAYGAIYDSGINPLQLRGKKVGVFIGSTFSESERIVIYENIQRNGFGITGSNKAMYANRISYWIDGKGPSYALDQACASSMACLEHAYRSISTGQCEAAIVGGCNLCMQPQVSLNLKRAGFLCMDGQTKCFDKNGDGYVRSDSINVLFLQKAKDAKRIYSEVYHAKGNYSFKISDQFLPIRESEDIEDFLKAFYSEINISPKDVEYIEANGSGIAEADGNELEAIGNVFAKETTINVGSVKSNMGNSEPASGVNALTKVCLAYHEGRLPANLHYNEPQDQITAVKEGRVQVLTENAPFNRGFTALNTFSYSGANIHVLLKGHYKQKELERYKSSLPYLVLASGRQDNCVKNILKTLKSQPIDPEQIGLLHSIHESDIPGHMCRGYTIIESNEQKGTNCLTENVEFCSGTTRPLWFVYSGMGSQWAGMGADLMRIPIFAAAVERCHRALEPKGIDIVKILTDPDKSIYDNILHSFVGIAAVQIGLTDILREMGVVPDNIIGHSVGELGCAYADGCFTAEEMILSAYSRGLVSVQTKLIRGSMAAVGLGYKAVLAMCPPEIEVACHNSSESSTISGPADIMKQFVADLTSRSIFAKEVPCSNIAFHSRYIADAGPGLLQYLSEVIKDPKPRSAKWVSTSVPKDQWDEPKAKYSSAEYHTNNLLNSVLFEETSKLIPTNALVIEVAPHGLLQAILKRSLSECINLPLTRRGHSDPVKFLLEAIGKLYQAGVNPKVDALYPKIEYPVSTETPLLSHFVEWEHSEDWPQAIYNSKDRITAIARDFIMSIHDDDYKHFRGHVRDGDHVFPEAALLVLVWETLAMHKGVKYEDMSVTFSDVQFYCEVHLRAEAPLKLGIMIHKGNHQFEISYENTQIVSGFITEMMAGDVAGRNLRELNVQANDFVLSSKDVYKTMCMRGYSYEDVFQSIQSSNTERNSANIKWTNDWVTFIDSLIQFNCFSRDHEGVSTPKLIKTLDINTKEHSKTKQITIDEASCYNAQIYSLYDISRCGGVELEGLVFTDKPAIDQEPDVLQTREFIPHFLSGNIEMKTALHVNLQIVTENSTDIEIKITQLFAKELPDISKVLKEVTDEIPTNNFIITDFKKNHINNFVTLNDKETNLIILTNLLADEKKMMYLPSCLSKKTFVLSIEQDTTVIHPKYEQFSVITTLTVQKQIFVLLKKAKSIDDVNVTYMPISQDIKFSWVPKVHAELQKSRRLVLISQRQPYCLIGVVKSLRKTYGDKISLVVVDDFHVPSFNPENTIYKEQLQKNLAFNILKKGKWGGYYNIPCTKESNIQNIALTSTIPGNLDTLTWVEESLTPSSNNLVQVYYAGPSFKDAQNATSNVSSMKSFGMDFSGINKRGEKVMGLVSGGSIRSTVEADLNLLWPVPEHWTLEDAATVPLPYILAYYCLTVRSKLRQGHTVFVNGGAGALGQAIISICLAIDCKVYTTVSDEQKKIFLLKRFPSLKEENIGNSRIDTFYNMVLKNTNNEGCDAVINCLSGIYRKAAMKCVGFSGFFLDVSDYDANENNDFGMEYLYGEKSYLKVQLSSLFRPENVNEKKKIQLSMAEGIAKGIVQPLSRVVYTPMDVTKAFRLVSSSRNRGKVLLRMRDPVTQGLKVTRRMVYSSKGAYIVVCDENELGIELVDRLVKRGAKNILMHIQPKCIGGYYHNMLASWKKLNATVDLSSENLQTEKGCTNLLKEGAKLGPILGIFIVQNFKDDAIQESIEMEDVAAKFNETAWIVANLDLKSRNVCNELKHFVVLNSLCQSLTDEYAVSVSEKICQARNDIGLPGLAFRVPLVKEFNNKIEQFQSTVQPQPLSAVFNALETSIKLNYKNVVTFDLKKRNETDLLEKVTRIIGVKHIDDLIDTMTLEDLSLNHTNLEEIKTTIREVLHINYPLEKIKKMSIACLKNLRQDMIKQATKFDSGLGAFYTYIDKDECMATEPMVAMPTKLSNATENEEELDPKAVYLMLIPGFEGHSQLFVPICERLKVQAMTFQLGPDLTDNSIQQMAANILKFMKKRFELKSKFYLLGYSFGVNVALELAMLFEKEGHVGIVYCLDSSPDALRVQLDAYVGNLTDTQLQDTIIKHMYHLMTGRDSEELTEDLAKIESWTDKVEACINRLRELVNYSYQYRRSILHTAYKRIQMAREYEPDFKLESQLVLMKGIPHPDAGKLADDYNLSKYTKQPVQVFNIESDHALAPQDCRVSNVINKLLEPKLIEEFNKKNICESYISVPLKKW